MDKSTEVKEVKELDYKYLYEMKCKELEELKKGKVDENKNDLVNLEVPTILFKKIVDEEYKKQESKNVWVGKIFSGINLLKNDFSGKTGERLIHNLCILGQIDNKYDEDINSKDGTYDIKIKGKKVEIKCARIGKHKSFQHENLRNGFCDYYIFVDIKPSCYYISVLPSFNLTKKHPYVGRKPHLRKGSDNIYKFDFGESNILNLIEEKMSIKVNRKTKLRDVVEFLDKSIR